MNAMVVGADELSEPQSVAVKRIRNFLYEWITKKKYAGSINLSA